MNIRLDQAAVGRGEESLHEAMQGWAQDGLHVHFYNVSRTDLFRDRPVAYWWDYVAYGQGVVDSTAGPKAALEIGTAMHKAAEHLLWHIDHGKGCNVPRARDEALRLALFHVEQAFGDEMSPALFEEEQAFRAYAPALIAAAAPKFDAQIDEVWATEELVWAFVPVDLGDHHVEYYCIVGRPDAVVVMAGKVWHMQHKTRGRETEYGNYVTALGFGGHETTYGWILTKLIARGAFGDRAGIEYGGSVIAMWLKQERPESSPAPLQKGLVELVNSAKVAADCDEGGTCHVARLGHCTDAQWEKAQGFAEKWSGRELRRRELLRSYDERAIQLVDADVTPEKMREGFRRVIQTAFLMAAMQPDTLFDEMLPCNPAGCLGGYRPCAHLEAQSCGGWDDQNPNDPDSKFEHRPNDYIDDLRAEYTEMLEVAHG